MDEASDPAGAERRGTPIGEARRSSPFFAKAFWATIALLFVGTIALVVLASMGSPDPATESTEFAPGPPKPVELPETQIEFILRESADAAQKRAERALDGKLTTMFQPVHAAVDDYADFHFSVMGEYAELLTAAIRSSLGLLDRAKAWWRGDDGVELDAETKSTVEGLLADANDRLRAGIEAQLYAGFDDRLETALETVDATFLSAFQSEVMRRLCEAVPDLGDQTILGDLARTSIEGALARARLGKPVSILAATGAGIFGAKALAGRALATAVKFAGKAAVKTTGISGGATTGAVLGSIFGPVGSVAGGVVGALAAWYAVDLAVIKVDEYLHREDFEREVHEEIDRQQAQIAVSVKQALAERRDMVGRTLEERVESAGSVPTDLDCRAAQPAQ